MSTTRQIRCPSCGAPKESLPDAVVVYCDFCGSFVAMDTRRSFRGDQFAEWVRKGQQSLLDPSSADSRKLALQTEMLQAKEDSDRERWRLAAQEFYALLPVTDPELLPAEARSQRGVGRWLQRTVQAEELMEFDDQVRAARARCVSVAQQLTQPGDPTTAARSLLDAAEEMYRALYSHPEYPVDGSEPESRHLAREYVRASIVGLEGMLGRGVAAKIYEEVLGDEPASGDAVPCRHCGASLPHGDEGLERCPNCGGVVQTDEDPWMANLLATWQVAAAQMPDDPSRAIAALNHALSSYWVTKSLPEAIDVIRFLDEAVADLPKSLLAQQCRLLQQAFADEAALRDRLGQIEALLR